MVSNRIDAGSGTGSLVIMPNRSMSWAANKILLGFMTFFLAMVSILFASMGLWPVIPWAGLELIVLWLSVYFTYLRLQRCELVTVTDTEVIYQAGRRSPEHEVRFPRCWTRFVVTYPKRGEGPAALYFRYQGQDTEVGRDLNRDEKKELMTCLRRVLRSVLDSRNASPDGLGPGPMYG